MNVRVGDPFSSHEAVSVAPLVTPVVICGTALWSMVKPGFGGDGELSAFHATLANLAAAGFQAPRVLASHKNRRLAAKLLRQAGVSDSALCLAQGAATTAGALRDIAAERAIADPDAVLLVLPDDMSVIDRPGLAQALALALPAARDGRIVCFGLDSTRATADHTWLEASDTLQIVTNVRSVEALSDPAALKLRHADRAWFWNSGVYLVSAQTLAALDDVDGRVETLLLVPTERLSMVKLDAGWAKSAKGTAALAEVPVVIDNLTGGNDFEVRRLTVAPGGSLDLTPQAGFTTHWTVVSSRACVKSRTGTREISGGQSLNVPQGQTHHIENPTAAPLVLIEVRADVRIGKAPLRRVAA